MKGHQDRAIIGQISLALDFQSITNDCTFRNVWIGRKLVIKYREMKNGAKLGMLEIKYVFNNMMQSTLVHK